MWKDPFSAASNWLRTYKSNLNLIRFLLETCRSLVVFHVHLMNFSFSWNYVNLGQIYCVSRHFFYNIFCLRNDILLEFETLLMWEKHAKAWSERIFFSSNWHENKNSMLKDSFDSFPYQISWKIQKFSRLFSLRNWEQF